MVDDGKWKVKSKAKRLVDSDGDSGFLDEKFDAVVVCSGHVTEPRISEIYVLLLPPRLKVFAGVVPIVSLIFLHILFRHQLVAWKANTQSQLSHS